MSASCLTARGVRPSPQVFSRGKVLRSTTATSCPCRANQYAADAPAGPAPTTRTSNDFVLGTAAQALGVVLMPSSSSVESPARMASYFGAPGAHQSANSCAYLGSSGLAPPTV